MTPPTIHTPPVVAPKRQSRSDRKHNGKSDGSPVNSNRLKEVAGALSDEPEWDAVLEEIRKRRAEIDATPDR
jgi:hypothetical protein